MSAAAHDNLRFRELLDALCNGELTDDERAELARLAASDQHCRHLAIDYLQLHVALQQELRSGQAADLALRAIAAKEHGALKLPVAAVRGRKWQSLSRVGPLSITVAAIVIGLLITAMALMAPPFYRVVWGIGEVEYAAELTGTHSAVWVDGQTGVAQGARLPLGHRCQLQAGIAELSYRDGVRVILEGPCEYFVDSFQSGRLLTGKLTAHVRGDAKGFRLDTPNSAILDLGTEFGAAVDAQRRTYVEVFEGVVDVRWGGQGKYRRRLTAGESLQIGADGVQDQDVQTTFVRAMPSGDADADGEGENSIVSNFDLAKESSCGWLTPWNAFGKGRVLRSVRDPLDDGGNAYMQASFEPTLGCLRRTYGKCGNVDPQAPHVIRWKWRFDGDAAKLTGAEDRIHFFADEQELSGSTSTNSWLIGITFGVEEVRRPLVGRWYFFDSAKSGQFSSDWDARNMVDTGLALRPGAVYAFEVVVHPQQAVYDATIFDGRQKFAAENLHFRNGAPGEYPVLHFGGSASNAGEDLTFSLDSIEIRLFDK